MSNEYSDDWFALFLRTIPTEQTAKEVDFVCRMLPDPPHHKLMDLCCGEGRHLLPLAARGYEMTGVDVSETALAAVETDARSAGVRLVRCDLRQLETLAPLQFDAVICLWQSFGYFDDVANAHVIQRISDLLVPSGRLILDLYHKSFFQNNNGTRSFERYGKRVTETKRMTGDRLNVVLDYGDGSCDEFDWQLFIPTEIEALGRRAGLVQVLSCSDFDERQIASADRPRFQVVFEKALSPRRSDQTS